jgi:triacylglycerol lipase
VKPLRKLYMAFAVLPLAACGPDVESPQVQPEQAVAVAQAEVSTTGLTPHFRNWLSANGYGSFDFARTDLVGGSYGGRASSTDTVTRDPVIFIHGNSDKAVGTGTAGQTGWNNSIQYFLSRGYKTSELYATTWGPASALLSSQQYHSRENLTRLRRFVEAVRAYTGATKVDIITHSMGVTLGRKVVLGGSGSDSGVSYNLGPAITSWVDTFVGIAGGNLGLTSCYLSGPTTPTCGSTNGLYPGYLYLGAVTGRSNFLNSLLATSRYEGAFRYTIHSTVDEIIGGGGLVYGQYTSRIPGQLGEKVYSAFPYGHFNVKDLTAEVQYEMVVNHRIP